MLKNEGFVAPPPKIYSREHIYIQYIQLEADLRAIVYPYFTSL